MTNTDDIKAADMSEERGSEPVKEGDHVAWKWGAGEMVSRGPLGNMCGLLFEP